jgi:hypothetical protein
MTTTLIVVLASLGVLATALVTFLRIDVVAFSAALYADEHEVDAVTTRTLLRRQRTVLTNLRLLQGEKCFPMGLPFWQHASRLLDLREINSVVLSQGMSPTAVFLAVLVAVVVLPVGWLLFVAALVYRVVAIEFRTNTVRVRVLSFRWRTAGLARFLGAVQRQARADKGLPQVLKQTPDGGDLCDTGWFDLDRSALIAIGVLVAVPLAQYMLRGYASVGDPLFGGVLIAIPAIVGARRGVLAGAAVGLLGTGGLLGGLCPIPFVQVGIPGPAELLAAGLMLGIIGAAAGFFAKFRPALGPFAVLAWLLVPAPFDTSLYQMSFLYVAVAMAGAISAITLATLAWVERGIRSRWANATTRVGIPIPDAPPLPSAQADRQPDHALGPNDPVFYLMDGEKTVGPVSGVLLRRGLEAGKVPITALVWKKGWEAWRNLGEVAELLDRFQSTHPPPLQTGPGLEALGRPSLPPPGAPRRQAK